ncbi:MAG TPA: DNA helicase PcrA [Nitrospirota bacterium]|nr:DNA helicase PcrA [Nitrospirota bacterium]
MRNLDRTDGVYSALRIPYYNYFMDYLENLNPPQREAVLFGDGPLLILAGAGSGKTRVITCRIAHLIRERNVDPSNILAVTFTNKAANEMRERVERMIDVPLNRLWISTFHSACVRILRQYADRLGYTRSFIIYDETDRSSLIKACMADLRIDGEQYQPRAISARISTLKNNLINAEQYTKTSSLFGFEEAVARAYLLYQEKLKESNGLDFDDLLMLTVKLFEQHQDVLAYYQGVFHHILIDEYQDTNHAQYRLVRLLTAQNKNLCVVGDDDQSIYRFRGADISNILNFEKDYPAAKEIKLEQNYRSTQNILGAAGAVVARNLGRKPKELWTQKRGGDKILCYRAFDEKDEARYICRTIQQEVDEGRSLRQIAVLYRTNAQSRALEDALRSHGVPYRIFGGLRFYDRKEIKDIIAYLRVLQNPADTVSLRRIINVPSRGIGDTTINKLERKAAQTGTVLYQTVIDADATDLTTSTKKKLQDFTGMMERMRSNLGTITVTDLVRRVIHESGYGAALDQDKTVESRIRLENLNELMTATEDFQEQNREASLASFLDQVALITDLEQQTAAESARGQTDSITLMTLHNAKGLEFSVVFLAGMEEGLFPHSRSVDSEEELEEERRLCYVGITRAKERLVLTHASERRLYGYQQSNMMSRFIQEIPREAMDFTGTDSTASYSFRDRVLPENVALDSMRNETKEKQALAPQTAKSGIGGRYYRGAVVRHAKFGLGTVQRSEGTGDDLKISVSFPGYGMKTLAVKYANLEVI